MENIQEDKILKFRCDTLEAVRKDINLDTRERMKDAVDILEDWVQKQPHFTKKDFSRDYLECTLVTAKGLVERAKERLDKLCTFKTLMPEFFSISDAKKEFSPLLKVILTAHMPHQTPENYRVYLSKVVSDKNLDSSVFFTFYKYLIVLSEYFRKAEYCSGFVVILDYSDANLMNVMTKVNPIELRQIITIMTEGYGLRIKSIHLITSSKTVDTMVTFLKQVFSAKLASRIHTHRSADTLYEYVPKDLLPVDYGGEEKSLNELQSQWLEVISSNDFQEYCKEMNQANTNESCRQRDKFNENYIGMPGSFRALSVD